MIGVFNDVMREECRKCSGLRLLSIGICSGMASDGSRRAVDGGGA